MYLPAHFKEEDPATLHALMAAHPLAALVTLGAEGLVANHLPLLHEGNYLRGHLARANSQWQNFSEDMEALAIFQGPQAYISPNWYPTKQETGRAVPTWNYAVVHVRGKLRVYSEPEPLRDFLDRLTATHEAGEPAPWKPADAPKDYIDGMLRAIVGIEISISGMEGKWKVSQNQPETNRIAAADALRNQKTEAGSRMADLILRKRPAAL